MPVEGYTREQTADFWADQGPLSFGALGAIFPEVARLLPITPPPVGQVAVSRVELDLPSYISE